MPLPWLIGGAIIAGAAVLTKSSSSKRKVSSYDYDEDEEEEERRAERDRKKQKSNISKEVKQHINAAYDDIQLTLLDLVKIEGSKINQIKLSQKYDKGINKTFSFSNDLGLYSGRLIGFSHYKSTKPLKGKKKASDPRASFIASPELKDIFPLCSNTTLANIHDFMQIYSVQVRPSDLLKQESSDIQALEVELKKLEQEIKNLKKLKGK